MSDSSSSATESNKNPGLDLVETRMLPPLAAAFMKGESADLLSPLSFGVEAPPAATEVDRSELARALAVANVSYGHPAGETMAEKLADPETRVVVTGQQPGLFGGPLYSLTKAVAATLWAERLQAEGTPAVAVFWVSTEDHDFREVAQCHFPTASGLESFDLGEDRCPLLPVGMRTFGEPVAEILAALEEGAPSPRSRQWLAQLASWYRPEVRFGEGFSRLLAHLLGERCPLLLDAMLPAVKAAQRPWLSQYVERRQEIEDAFTARDAEIEARGFPLQVKPQRGASPLFVLHGQERRRVEWRGEDRFSLRGQPPFEEDVEWLSELVADNPAAISAGVMGRSALQDAILGTSVLVLGPGEVSYMPQVAPVYEVLGISPPTVALRPQAMVLAQHQVEKLDALALDLAELLAPDFSVDGFLASGKADDVVEPVRRAVLDEIERLGVTALEIDSDLAKPLAKTKQQIDKALGAFSGRVTATVARRDTVRRQRVEDLLSTCLPGGALQERKVSTAYFPGKFGAALMTALFSQLTLDSRRLHLIIPGDDS